MLIQTILLAAFTLVGAEKQATVVIPANAEDSTTYAADVLVEYVEKMTGKRLEVKGRGEDAASTRGAIIIGTLKTLGAAVPKDVIEKLKASKQFEARGRASATARSGSSARRRPANTTPSATSSTRSAA